MDINDKRNVSIQNSSILIQIFQIHNCIAFSWYSGIPQNRADEKRIKL